MAIYHLSIKIISRGKNKSAVAASAYRSGEKIKNEYDGIVHDFTRKGGIAHTEILLPQNAPQEFSDRGKLWNSVEKIEKIIKKYGGEMQGLGFTPIGFKITVVSYFEKPLTPAHHAQMESELKQLTGVNIEVRRTGRVVF